MEKSQFVQYATTSSNNSRLQKIESEQWNYIKKYPIVFSNELTRRWRRFGENFPFPEAAPLVFMLLAHINKHELLNQTLQLSKLLVVQELENLDNITVWIDDSTSTNCPEYLESERKIQEFTKIPVDKLPVWPDTLNLNIPATRAHTYTTPYEGMSFPYASTMRWVARAMDFLDLVFFSEYAVRSKSLQGLYFRGRFRYYYDYILNKAPNVYVFPTCTLIGATDLLKMRCSAIQPLGIEWKPIFVDEYIQSPCNFFWHDVNHARRIYQHNEKLLLSRNPIPPVYWDKLYSYQSEVCRTLMQLCKKKQKYKRLVKMILFEVVHEDAVSWDWQQIWNDILLPSGNCFPYENSVSDPNGHRRTVKYYAKSAPTLATFYNKIRHEFFEQDTIHEYIIEAKYRTLEHTVNAVIEILQVIQPHISSKIPPREFIEALIISQEYCEAKHTQNRLSLPDDVSFKKAIVRHSNM